MLNREIIETVEQFAPPTLQERWDNTGIQVGSPDDECTGVLICFDVTPEVVAQAKKLSHNLIISHHPLLFNGVKSIIGATRQQQSIIDAIKGGITIYSSHTAMDSTKGGVSYAMAKAIGVKPEKVLSPAPGTDQPQHYGLGIYGTTEDTPTASAFIERTKTALHAKALRMSRLPFGTDTPIERVAMCGGSGHEFIPTAISLGAQVYISGDIRYHDFIEYQDKILIIDAGHYETEAQIKEVVHRLLDTKYQGQLPITVTTDDNPVEYR